MHEKTLRNIIGWGGDVLLIAEYIKDHLFHVSDESGNALYYESTIADFAAWHDILAKILNELK